MIYRTYKAMRMKKTDAGGMKLADLSSNYFVLVGLAAYLFLKKL